MTNDPYKRLHVHHLVFFFFVMQDNCCICEYLPAPKVFLYTVVLSDSRY